MFTQAAAPAKGDAKQEEKKPTTQDNAVQLYKFKDYAHRVASLHKSNKLISLSVGSNSQLLDCKSLEQKSLPIKAEQCFELPNDNILLHSQYGSYVIDLTKNTNTAVGSMGHHLSQCYIKLAGEKEFAFCDFSQRIVIHSVDNLQIPIDEIKADHTVCSITAVGNKLIAGGRNGATSIYEKNEKGKFTKIGTLETKMENRVLVRSFGDNNEILAVCEDSTHTTNSDDAMVSTWKLDENGRFVKIKEKTFNFTQIDWFIALDNDTFVIASFANNKLAFCSKDLEVSIEYFLKCGTFQQILKLPNGELATLTNKNTIEPLLYLFQKEIAPLLAAGSLPPPLIRIIQQYDAHEFRPRRDSTPAVRVSQPVYSQPQPRADLPLQRQQNFFFWDSLNQRASLENKPQKRF